MLDELQSLIEGFVEESQESFEIMEEELLKLESAPEDEATLNSIFRIMHTIKGTGAFLGLNDISTLAHRLESYFENVRKKVYSITPEVMDQVLPAIDQLKQLVSGLNSDGSPDIDIAITLSLLDKLIESQKEVTAPAKDSSEETVIKDTSKETITPIVADVQKDEEMARLIEKLKLEFYLEADEHLNEIEESLLKLEKTPSDSETINKLFRAIHSIKGSADYVNLSKITNLAHTIENVIDLVRVGKVKFDKNLGDQIFVARDLLRTLVFMSRMKEDDSVILVDDIIEQMNQYLSIPDDTPSEKQAPKITQSLPNEIIRFLNIVDQQMIVLDSLGEQLIKGELDIQECNTLHRAFHTIKQAANYIEAAYLVSICTDMEELMVSVLAEEVTIENIHATFLDNFHQLKTEIQMIRDGEPPSSKVLQKQESALAVTTTPSKKVLDGGVSKEIADKELSAQAEIKTMRIDANRLDNFMNLIGELFISRNTLNHVINEITGEPVRQDLIQKIKAVETSFNRLTDNLQNNVMEMRLIPIKTVFQKIPRIIRDISRKNNKQIQLKIIGENTEIDKSIVELIGDPLVHIIRNSCDHGIETAEERKKAGKPSMGTIILKAGQFGGAITIEIIDDGAGINLEKVKQKALERKMFSAKELEQMSKKDIHNLIFAPGFSTANKVTDVSGRGVGMDVVLTNIKRIHGSVEISSDEGEGSNVQLILPLTLAVVEALIVVVNTQCFAIPLEAIKETIKVKQKEIQFIKHKEVIDIRGDIVGIARLADLLNLDTENNNSPDTEISIVFLKVGNIEIGIAVDDLRNQQEIVVKPLQTFLSQIPGIKGSTILGNGEVILILEPNELIELASD